MTDQSQRTTPTWLDGLYLTLLGVPDLWVVVDCPRCLSELLVESAVGEHAWRHRLMRLDGNDRLFSTDMGIGKVEHGQTAALLARLETLSRRGPRPGAVLVSEMAPSRLVGNDLDGLAASIAAATGAPARAIHHLSLTRDWLDAFKEALAALVELLPDVCFTGDRDAVAVVGHLLDRPEADGLSDVREVVRLLSSLGVEVAAVWTSGSPVETLARAGTARRILALPYGHDAARRIAARSGAEVLELGLPIGLDGTATWLREAGAWLGREREAGQAVEAGLRAVVPGIAPLVPCRIAGRRIGVVADPATATGLSAFLAELGADVVRPLIRCRRPEDVPEGLRSDDGIRRHDPSLDSLRAWFRAATAVAPLDLVIGSSREREMLPAGIPFLEMGYPSVHWRPLSDAPRLGFAGALHLVERISNRLAETRYDRLRAAAREGDAR